ncbi:MAG: GGDEF domain-containing protein [Oleiphilaceae bacterium]|nr:GGDEF domain-containing protein [Oleiphilaceae bacterium]
MTETQLRTYTHFTGYGLAALFAVILAVQNLRYGFYELFYLALSVTLLTLGGAVYTVVCRRRQLRAPGHLAILAALNAVMAGALLLADNTDLSYWCQPVLVLNILVLQLRHGILLSLALWAILAISVLGRTPALEALFTIMASLTLVLTASLYIWHYNHMAQSAEDLAITDPVTGAHNARFLDETLQKEISRTRVTRHPLSVIMLRIDYLDEVRALHGESGQQRLIKEVTYKLFDVIRAGDTLYTLENGEFFLILPFTPEEGVRVIAERIRRTLTEHRWPVTGRLTVSVGCTTRAAADQRSDTLLRRAREALHEASERGRDTIWYAQGTQH